MCLPEEVPMFKKHYEFYQKRALPLIKELPVQGFYDEMASLSLEEMLDCGFGYDQEETIKCETTGQLWYWGKKDEKSAPKQLKEGYLAVAAMHFHRSVRNWALNEKKRLQHPTFAIYLSDYLVNFETDLSLHGEKGEAVILKLREEYPLLPKYSRGRFQWHSDWFSSPKKISC